MNILYQRIYNQFSIVAPKALQQQLQQIEIDKEYITNVIVIVGTHECKKKTKHLQINDQMLLKIEKDQNKPPITDLSFYYLDIHDGHLKIEPNLQICTIQENDIKWHYQNGNLEFTYDLSKNFGYQSNQKQALVLCQQTNPLCDPWKDLILLQKTQAPPEGFIKLSQSIQNQYLSYSLTKTYFTQKYEVEIADSYPQNSGQIEIAQFCFPSGSRMYRENQLPKYNHYILTTEEGVRQYCSALIFCEQNIKGYHEMAIVLKSNFNYSEQSLELLKNLYQIYNSKNILPLERYICNIVDEIVMPQDSSETCIYNGAKQIYFFQSNCFPICSNQAFQCLFGALSKKNIVLLYFAILLEKKIQLISSKPVVCSLIIEALMTLLYPFEYTHILISSLPEDIEQYLEAPLPYLIGVTKQQAERYPEAIQVYLDSNHIKQNKHFDIAEEIFDKFVLKLKGFDKYYSPTLIETIDNAFPIPRDEELEQIDQYEIREVFLRFNIFILSDYKKYIEKQVFKDKQFLKNKSRVKSFLEPFLDTRLFTYFIQERMELSQNNSQLEYFDDCLKNPKGDHFTLPVQTFKEYLKPNDEGFQKDNNFHYSTFPLKLNDDFFTKPRLEFLKHEDAFQIKFNPKTNIEFLRFELQFIYKNWFRWLVYQIEQHNLDLTELVKFSLNLPKEMHQNKLFIDCEIFKNAMIACAHYQLNELALEFIHQMRQLGYQKYIQIYQYYFQTIQQKKQSKKQKTIQHCSNSSQSLSSQRQKDHKFYLEAKCSKCGRRYNIEDILGSFVSDQMQCSSYGTLGCNNKFFAQLFHNGKVQPLLKPSLVKDDKILMMFYFYLLGLPYHFIKNEIDDEIVYVQKKCPIFLEGNTYTDDQDDYEVNQLVLAVHDVFGLYFNRIKEILGNQQSPHKTHERKVSDLSD